MSLYVYISRFRGEPRHYVVTVGSDAVYSRRCETEEECREARGDIEEILRTWRQ
jgi:hypothetical protein